MTVRIGVNGFGRIGRDVVRCVLKQPDRVEIVAVNDVAPTATLAHLLSHDSTYGGLGLPVTVDGDEIVVITPSGDVRLATFMSSSPTNLPWRELGVDVVIEATGHFRDRASAAAHLAGGARKVIVTAPGKDADATIVLGVNDHDYEPDRHHVVSNASCTTNCVAPMVDVLHRAFGVRRGLMTTIHSYTNDQALLDRPHSDLRRARSAAVNVIPTSTGAARAVGLVIPSLAGRLDGVAVRVPVEDGSLTDLVVELDRDVTVAVIDDAFAEAAAGRLKGILRHTTEPVVSRDIVGDPSSCVFDSGLIRADGRMAKVFGWYDNEWGYANRTVELADMIGRSLP